MFSLSPLAACFKLHCNKEIGFLAEQEQKGTNVEVSLFNLENGKKKKLNKKSPPFNQPERRDHI